MKNTLDDLDDTSAAANAARRAVVALAEISAALDRVYGVIMEAEARIRNEVVTLDALHGIDQADHAANESFAAIVKVRDILVAACDANFYALERGYNEANFRERRRVAEIERRLKRCRTPRAIPRGKKRKKI